MNDSQLWLISKELSLLNDIEKLGGINTISPIEMLEEVCLKLEASGLLDAISTLISVKLMNY